MFKVKKHCQEAGCGNWTIEWPTAEDDDGIPVVGLVWEGVTSVPWVFPSKDDAERVTASLNLAMHSDSKPGQAN